MTAFSRRAIPKRSGLGLVPILPVPVINEREREPKADYLLDAGVGFAFAHAKAFRFLAEHYQGRLYVSEAVLREWDSRGRSQVRSPRSHPGGVDQAARDQRLKDAGLWLANVGSKLLTGILPLTQDAVIEVGNLQRDLADMPRSEPFNGGNLGECASIWEGRRLRSEGRPIVILCADDDKARRLAQRNGLAARSTPQILREMVTSGLITEVQAFNYFRAGLDVCRPHAQVVIEFPDPAAFT
jgi:hypothetical protein